MEAKIAPLLSDKKRLYNDFVMAKGNVKVFCRSRPAFVDEGLSIVEFPDDFTIRINTSDENATCPTKYFEFHRVFGPHVGQAELFNDVHLVMQSALDGYNVPIFLTGNEVQGKHTQWKELSMIDVYMLDVLKSYLIYPTPIPLATLSIISMSQYSRSAMNRRRCAHGELQTTQTRHKLPKRKTTYLVVAVSRVSFFQNLEIILVSY